MMTLTLRVQAGSQSVVLVNAFGVMTRGQPAPARISYPDSFSAPDIEAPQSAGAVLTRNGRYFGGTQSGSTVVGRGTVDFSIHRNCFEGASQVYGNAL
jgi:hypothetical protein